MSNFQQSLIKIASGEVGQHEEGGNNLGRAVRKYQKATTLAPGAWPWCAAFVAWCVQQALQDQEACNSIWLRDAGHAERWRCKSARAYDWESWGDKKKLLVLPETERALAGDIVTFDFSHIGIVVEDQRRGGQGVIQTVEGNTNGAGQRDSATGDGVWRKERNWKLIRRLVRVPHK